MSSGLTEAVDAGQLRERRRAARALLARPLLRAEDEAFPAVRRHAPWLTQWFETNVGWTLRVDRELARLVKVVPAGPDATRPARDRSGEPFSRRRYVLLCLALAALERADAQITLGDLAESVILEAADEELRRCGVEFRLEGRQERSDIVAVVRLLLTLGVLKKVAGDDEAFVRDAGDALYDVDRSALATLIAAPGAPSEITGSVFEDRLAALVPAPLHLSDEQRTRTLRHTVTRRLLDDPVVYYDELGEDERTYLIGQRAAIVGRISELTGLVAEIRAEGLAMVDPQDGLTDVRMPENGTDGHVTLLLAGALANGIGSPAVELSEIHTWIRQWAVEHQAYWRKAARAPGAEKELADQALRRLEALRLIRLDADGARGLPALARYAVGAPTMLGSGP